jgi:hypothetical protein
LIEPSPGFPTWSCSCAETNGFSAPP